jgi:hypothetical protein
MAPVTLNVRDETTTGELLKALELQFEVEEVTIAELITARVRQEVREHNARRALAPFSGLVTPSQQERELNSSRKPGRRVDADAQVKVALDAFTRGQILLLVDDRQVDELEERVLLRAGSTVTFLKLVPLMGG